MKINSILITSIILSTVAFTTNLKAQVYGWEDEKGVKNYSSKPPYKGAKPADLPPIMWEKNMPDSSASVRIGTVCANHGGTDCQSGADEDGSVICVDGFTESNEQFEANCTGTKLELSEVEDTTKKGAQHVWIRNTGDIPAKNVVITGKNKDTKVTATGPETIPPLEVGEYVFKSLDPETKIVKNEISINCSNCG
jgi:hypothetical protein